ncbi:MAG: CoA pyrophosphatase [Flavobacteriales bacterium]|nr:CoA pyrophosphatase [Flavobacteriales bacterium]
MMDELIARLSQRFSEPLPGIKAQMRMSSALRAEAVSQYKIDASKARTSAVLIALYPDNGVIRTVLMKRPDYDGTHSGQVSFPGGKKEESDKDVIETALREAEEEVAIKPTDVQVIGQLTELYIPPSNFLVHPIVGILKKVPKLVPDKHEVEHILQPELNYLFREDIGGEKEVRINNGLKLRTPYFTVDGHTVWGATAMIISELKEVMASIR